MYFPEIEFEYEIDGRTYESTDHHLVALHSGIRLNAELLIERYPENATVDVFYNPNEPAVGVLEQSRTYRIFDAGLLLFFAGFLLMGLGHLVFGEWDISEIPLPDGRSGRELATRALLTITVVGYLLSLSSFVLLLVAKVGLHGVATFVVHHMLDLLEAQFDGVVEVAELYVLVVLVLPSWAALQWIPSRWPAVAAALVAFCGMLLLANRLF